MEYSKHTKPINLVLLLYHYTIIIFLYNHIIGTIKVIYLNTISKLYNNM